MSKRNRIDRLVPLTKSRSPVYNMKILLSNLSPSTIVPQQDKYYVFVYKAKTPGIRYDKHPFIVVTGLYKWGFTGINFHWNGPRRYTWGEVVSNLYEIHETEFKSMTTFPIAAFRKS